MVRGPTSTEHVHNASLMRKFSRIAVGGFGRQVAVFAVNGYLAWTLSKDVFGTFTCAYGSLMVTIGLADFGLRQVGWREIARNPQRIASIVDEIVAARLVTTLIGMAGFLACAGMYCRHPQDWIVFLAFSPGLLFNMTSFDFPFMGQDRVETINKSSTVAYAYYVLASLLTVGGDSSAWLAAIHFVVAHAIFVALLHKEYRRMVGPLRPLFRPRVILGYYKLSWPLGLNFFIFRLTTNYPVLLLGLIVSSAAVAEYRVAELFYSLFASLGLYLGSSTFTTFASYGKDGNRDIARSVEIAVRTILLGLMPVGFLFATLLPTVLAWWLNETSPMAALTCFFLGISLPLGVATRYLKTCLPSIGLNAQLLSVNVASLALGVGAGALAYPYGRSAWHCRIGSRVRCLRPGNVIGLTQAAILAADCAGAGRGQRSCRRVGGSVCDFDGIEPMAVAACPCAFGRRHAAHVVDSRNTAPRRFHNKRCWRSSSRSRHPTLTQNCLIIPGAKSAIRCQ